MSPDITLKLAGATYTGWQRVRVSTGLEQLAGTFSLDLTDKWALDGTEIQIRDGMACQVLIHGQPVITGWVDTIEPQYDDESHTLRVSGRDRAGDLVDCAAIHAQQEWVGRTIDQIARNAVEPFGMSVRAEVDTGGPFRYAHAEPGETVHELLERAARFRGLLIVSDGATGDLVLTRAGTERAAGSLDLGRNIVSANARRSQRDRFSEYRVLGQQREDETIDAEMAATSAAKVRDSGVGRYRPTVIMADEAASIGECQTRAQFERGKAVANSQRATLVVTGWADEAGDVWRANRLIAVRDRWSGLDGDYLIASVEMTYDDADGPLSAITVLPPGAYARLAETETNPAARSEIAARPSAEGDEPASAADQPAVFGAGLGLGGRS